MTLLQGKQGGGKRKKWPWVVGVIALIVIVGAVLGGVLGSRAANDNKSNNVAGSNNNNNNGAASAATRTKGSGNEAVVPTVSLTFSLSHFLLSHSYFENNQRPRINTAIPNTQLRLVRLKSLSRPSFQTLPFLAVPTPRLVSPSPTSATNTLSSSLPLTSGTVFQVSSLKIHTSAIGTKLSSLTLQDSLLWILPFTPSMEDSLGLVSSMSLGKFS